MSKVGVLEKAQDGNIKLNIKASLNGGTNKVLTDSKGHIFVLGSDLILINKSGQVLRRWGPYVYDFLIDHEGNLYICYVGALGVEIYDSSFKLIKKMQQWSNGKFIGTEWGKITWPYHIDDAGNLYGFINGKDNILARYSPKEKRTDKFSIKQDDFTGASWTVDRQGNIYYAEAYRSFTVTKISEVSKGVR